MQERIARVVWIAVVVACCATTVRAAGSVAGYVFRSKGVVIWSDVGGNNNVIEQNEKPGGEVWTTISLPDVTYGGNMRTSISVDHDPPPPVMTVGHQLRVNLVKGDVVQKRPPPRRGDDSPQHVSQNSNHIPLDELMFYQGASLDDGTRIDEHWAPGQIWIYHLNPAEAQWVQTSTPTLTATGDVTATLMSVTSTDVTVRIDSNPTTTTEDDLAVHGLAIDVHPDSQFVHLYQGFQGSCGLWMDGVKVDSTTHATPRFHLAYVMPVAPSVPAMRPLSVFALAIVLLGVGSVAVAYRSGGYRISAIRLLAANWPRLSSRRK